MYNLNLSLNNKKKKMNGCRMKLKEGVGCSRAGYGGCWTTEVCVAAVSLERWTVSI